jgi:hypothetical protein
VKSFNITDPYYCKPPYSTPWFWSPAFQFSNNGGPLKCAKAPISELCHKQIPSFIFFYTTWQDTTSRSVPTDPVDPHCNSSSPTAVIDGLTVQCREASNTFFTMNPEGIEYTIVLSFVFRTHLFDVYKGGTGWGKYTKRYDKGDRSDLGVTSILMKPDGTRIASYAPGTFMTHTRSNIGTGRNESGPPVGRQKRC